MNIAGRRHLAVLTLAVSSLSLPATAEPALTVDDLIAANAASAAAISPCTFEFERVSRYHGREEEGRTSGRIADGPGVTDYTLHSTSIVADTGERRPVTAKAVIRPDGILQNSDVGNPRARVERGRGGAGRPPGAEGVDQRFLHWGPYPVYLQGMGGGNHIGQLRSAPAWVAAGTLWTVDESQLAARGVAVLQVSLPDKAGGPALMQQRWEMDATRGFLVTRVQSLQAERLVAETVVEYEPWGEARPGAHRPTRITKTYPPPTTPQPISPASTVTEFKNWQPDGPTPEGTRAPR